MRDKLFLFPGAPLPFETGNAFVASCFVAYVAASGERGFMANDSALNYFSALLDRALAIERKTGALIQYSRDDQSFASNFALRGSLRSLHDFSVTFGGVSRTDVKVLQLLSQISEGSSKVQAKRVLDAAPVVGIWYLGRLDGWLTSCTNVDVVAILANLAEEFAIEREVVSSFDAIPEW